MKAIPPNVFASLDELLCPAAMSALVGSPVAAVERAALEAAHLSGNRLELVTAVHAGGAARFVLKTFDPRRDWIMRLTHDSAVREVALFRHSIYARLPRECEVPIVAVARTDGAWASLMLDVSAYLEHGASTPLALPALERYVRHLAAIHATFLGRQALAKPALGLSSLHDFVTILAPATVRGELAAGRTHPVLEAAARGWEVFREAAPPAAVRVVERLQHDPRPLLELLAGRPPTLLHGDYKPDNLGSRPRPAGGERDAATIVLDWQDAALGPPLLDLGYFLAVTAARLPAAGERVIELYREALASRGVTVDDAAWERDVALGLLAGGALRLLWRPALGTQSPDAATRSRAQRELEWWSEAVVRAGRLLP